MFKTRKLYWIICNLVDFIGAEMAVEESMKFYIAAPGNVPFSDDESCGIGSYELGFLGYFCCVKKRRGGGGGLWGEMFEGGSIDLVLFHSLKWKTMTLSKFIKNKLEVTANCQL